MHLGAFRRTPSTPALRKEAWLPSGVPSGAPRSQRIAAGDADAALRTPPAPGVRRAGVREGRGAGPPERRDRR